ncbi:uncharacterized protein K444DRAFT_362732 [Hyaloscypha bicolor E]|uniref:Uncharacterized protein n=1 Tax=Hyaloscypha bicolor E TaxID=1095630 RepID=A0A2J6TGI8_9HELO|nr:uncharacterized protein K444DRAFT_362732 [Hyaloscypha bicolor E]PMD62132.1 hypothetical protein K444DRAFT_362732 [Hyaloscypha bicolor E]
MSRNFSLKLIVIKILEKINVLFFYYITLLWKVLGVALGISATFRTRQFWCSCAHSVDGRFSTPVAFVCRQARKQISRGAVRNSQGMRRSLRVNSALSEAIIALSNYCRVL